MSGAERTVKIRLYIQHERAVADRWRVMCRSGGVRFSIGAACDSREGAARLLADFEAATCPQPDPAAAPEAADGVLERVAEIAHAGGLEGLTEGEALCRIRRLSLPWWRKAKTGAAAMKGGQGG